MLSTEVQRVVLLIGLAATAYLLILAWNDDYMRQQEPAQIAAEPDLQDVPAMDAPAPADAQSPADAPASADETAPAGDTAGASDVPDPSLVGEGQQPPREAPGDASAPEDRLVEVVTPTLHVWIDRVGGDIVRVQLPRHRLDIDQPEPYLLLNRGGGHTYIAQSGLVGPDGVDASGERPVYEAEKSEYQLTGNEPLTVTLTTEAEGQRIRKSYVFSPDDYLVDLRYRLENRTGEPLNAGLFAQIKRDDREGYGEKPFTLGPQPYLGAALTTDESRYEKVSFEDLDEEAFQSAVEGGWIAFLQHYFLSAWVADPEQTNRFYGHKHRDGTYIVGYTAPLASVPAGGVGEFHSRFYAGPKDQSRLEDIAPNLNLTVDYGFLWWLAVPLFKVLDWIYGVVGNWGAAIILLTVLVKLALYPLSAASYRSMANMRRIAPQMKRLQERYADDRQKLSQEMMALYKKEQVNPLGGCLPMLLPMPIFIALYWVLFESVELRHAPFMLWIRDLSAMDPYFVLPLLMGASMYLQQLMSPAVGDPMQQRMMRLMPVMFTVLFLFFPAGLVLYWLVNNVLSIAQQWWIMRQNDAKHAART
ncbi:MAG: membrane protein insertase YidC [Pseudomonadota bacterium]